MNDKLLILEDEDGDGQADKCTVFADNLHCPTGFELCHNGVFVAQAPDLLFLKDTNGDGKADQRTRVLHGLDSADTHHTANSFVLDPGGALYFQEGTFHHTQVETPYGPPVRCANAGVFRYEPRTQKFEVYVNFPFDNPHGHVFDRWGQDFVIDGTGSRPFHAALFSGHLEFPKKHAKPLQLYEQRTRPCPGMEILSSRHFPEAMQGNLLVANVIGFQGILQYRIEDKGASFVGTEVEPILSSTDENFRPSDIKIGPDGAIYFLDWHNHIIGHMQHNLRDPSRDREHGRIYRVTCPGRPLSKSPKIAAEPIATLLDLLKQPEDRVRYRVRMELGGRATDAVISATKEWIAALDADDPNHEHHLLEALWLHQSHNVINRELLQRLLGSPEFRARAAATRVLCYWRNRVPDVLPLLKKLAADPHPRVRLEAVRAASFFPTVEALEVMLIGSQQPTDIYLTFVQRETIKALDPLVRKLASSRQPFPFPSYKRQFVQIVSTEDLLQMERDEAVYGELLCRKGIRDELRREAATALAGSVPNGETAMLLAAARETAAACRGRGALDDSTIIDLMRLAADSGQAALTEFRPQLADLAANGSRPVTRELAFVALVVADSGVDRAWSLAVSSPRLLHDLLHAIPLIRDPGHRADFYAKVAPLLQGPSQLTGDGSTMRRAAMNAVASMRGREADAFKLLSALVSRSEDRSAAIEALLRIPRVHWPADEAVPLLNKVLAYLRKVPAKERTSPAARDALQLADALTALLPPADARSIRKELADLGVRVIRVGTVVDQMLFDPERIAVQAGKPVEIRFENTDAMPHNLVIVQPGSLEEIGAASEATATAPDAMRRNYVPASPHLIFASRLLQPREVQHLQFTAPAKPGIYPYVCTYPGHWRRMYGALYVVADLDEYLAEPDSYVTTQALAPLDPMLKSIRARTEWRMDDLGPAVESLSPGRSFANGKRMFEVATCVACHKMNSVGAEFGPDLTKLDPKNQKPIEVLRDILDPSFRIHEKYQTAVFGLHSGKVITGVVLDETPEAVRLIENPLVKAEPVTLRKTEIAEQTKSPASVMPKGLLDKLSREEILDLLAYIVAGGDPKHPLFRSGHHRAHPRH
jgi:putative heme-binding domain-containing protein